MDSIKNNYVDNREAVTIHADKVLDHNAQDTFIRASRHANHPDIQAIVVDFTATRGIRASGVGVLLMLSGLGRKFSFQVKLVNCNPQVRAELASSRLLTDLSIA